MEIIKVNDYGPCPNCKQGKLKLKDGKFGKFVGCSAYPVCNYTKNILPRKGGGVPQKGVGKARASYIRAARN